MAQLFKLRKNYVITQFIIVLLTGLSLFPLLYVMEIQSFQNSAHQRSALGMLQTRWWPESIYAEIALYPTPLALAYLFFGLFTVSTALSLLHFLHSKRGRDFSYSLPFNKQTLYLASYLQGLVTLFIPLLMTKSTFLLVHVTLSPATNPVGEVATGLLMAWGMLLVVYTLNCLACTLSRSTAQALILMSMFQVGAVLLFLLGLNLMESLLFGFGHFFGTALLGSWLAYTSPAMVGGIWTVFGVQGLWLTAEPTTMTDHLLFWPSLLWLVLGASSFVWSLVHMKKHQSEHIGKGVTTGFSAMSIKAIVTLGSGLLVSWLFTIMSHTPPTTLAVQIAFLLGSLLGFVVIQAIIARKADWVNSAIQYGVLLVIGQSFVTGIATGGWGFSRRVPEPSQVVSVALPHFHLPFIPNFASHIPWDQRHVTHPELIALVIALHQNIVSMDGPLNLDNPELFRPWTPYTFDYTLANGSQLTRRFELIPLQARQLTLTLMAHPAFIQVMGVPFHLNEHVSNLELHVQSELWQGHREGADTSQPLLFSSFLLNLTPLQVRQLVLAMQADMMTQSFEQLFYPLHGGLFELHTLPFGHRITVFPWWEHTVQILADFGYQVERTPLADRVVKVHPTQLELFEPWGNPLPFTNENHQWLTAPWQEHVVGYGDHQVFTDPIDIYRLSDQGVNIAPAVIAEQAEHYLLLFYHGDTLATTRLYFPD